MRILKKEKFSEELQEVIDFALNGKFLFSSVKPDNLDVVVVEQTPADWLDAGPNGKNYSKFNEDEWTYRDIVSEHRCPAVGVLSRDETKNKLSDQIFNLLSEQEKLYVKIERKLENHIKDASLKAECIESDLLDCANWRICFGRKDGFWETVFQVYKSGGMPVGWSGNYPEGKLMVIYPGL